MKAIFLRTLNRFRGQIIGWGLSLALLGLFIIPFYDTLAEQREELEKLISNYPPEMMAFFGGIDNLFTPEGYLTMEYFSLMPIIMGIFAVLAGSGLLVSDEENGTLDLLLAQPISRSQLFVGRLLALVTSSIAILGIAWLGMVLVLNRSTMDVSPGALLLPFLSLLAVMLLFAMLALLLSLLLPARRLAAMMGGMVLVASYFITSLARVETSLERLANLSPLNYYQSGEAILGLNLTWLIGLLTVTALFAALSWWLFERRDIRVAGEGGWRIPLLRRRVTT